jgi:hypothetical protein
MPMYEFFRQKNAEGDSNMASEQLMEKPSNALFPTPQVPSKGQLQAFRR